MALTQQAHQLVNDHFQDTAKDLAVDGTCGNGYDTELLVRMGFSKVIGFDVQQTAISNTRRRLEKAGLIKIEPIDPYSSDSGDGDTKSRDRLLHTNEHGTVELIHTGHEHLGQHMAHDISCAMFNFGYLPKADKTISTLATTSLLALNSAFEKLSNNGLISLICYPGHEQGYTETHAIQQWLATIENRTVAIEEYLSTNPTDTTPILYLVKPKS